MKRTIAILALISLAFGCAHAPSSSQILERVYAYDDVDEFVSWRVAQPGVSDVNVNKNLFLTTSPPKVMVTYFRDGREDSLLIAVEPDKKLKLVKPE